MIDDSLLATLLDGELEAADRAPQPRRTAARRQRRLDVQMGCPPRQGRVSRISFGLLLLFQQPALVRPLAATSRAIARGAAIALTLDLVAAPFAFGRVHFTTKLRPLVL